MSRGAAATDEDVARYKELLAAADRSRFSSETGVLIPIAVRNAVPSLIARIDAQRVEIARLLAIMSSELDESGWACSCGEPRYKGKPCVACHMAAAVAGKPVRKLFLRSANGAKPLLSKWCRIDGCMVRYRANGKIAAVVRDAGDWHVLDVNGLTFLAQGTHSSGLAAACAEADERAASTYQLQQPCSRRSR